MFVAQRTMKIGKEDRRPGRPVPEAAEWDPHTCKRLVEQGYMADMTLEEAGLALKKAESDDRIAAIKSAQKRIRKSKARLAVLEPVLAKAEADVAEIYAQVEELDGACTVAAAELEVLGASDLPELSDRKARAEARRLLFERDAAKHAAPVDAPDVEASDAETEPAHEDAQVDAEPEVPEVDPEAGIKLRARLAGHTKVQLLEVADDLGLVVGDRLSKSEMVEAMAVAMEEHGETVLEDTDPADD